MKNSLISRDWLDRLVHAHDASVYRMVPHSVARPQSLDDVRFLLDAARSQGLGLTFRAGGTSLSGQAVTHGMLVVLERSWSHYNIDDRGRVLTCGPALRGGVANAALAPFGRRIGPDPASLHAACMGGIVANNASGMCCGVEENAYRTIEGMKVLLASGTCLDTRKPDCEEMFRSMEPELYARLLNLRDNVLGSARLVELIRRKASTKNTTGYGLSSFLDFSSASDLLTHLMVGSEGTLAFLAELTLRTVPLRAHRASALLSFDQMEDACDRAPELRSLGFSAVELLDFASVQAILNQPQVPAFLNHLGPRGACLLIQAQEESAEELSLRLEGAHILSKWRTVAHRTDFVSDSVLQEQLWNIRKGIFPAVGARRPKGTSVIIEDVAFPLEALANGATELRVLLDRHGYQDAVIYGHARDGNLHFVMSQNFAIAQEVRRYERFIDEMVDCVAVRFGGALKAEHGTGRNMAPFVEKEWGSEAYSLMRELKAIFDPENLLNPGVLIQSNPRAHLEYLKTMPSVDEQIDACIECGFCEPVCPSQGLTLSPRGRIILQREMQDQQNASLIDPQAQNYQQMQTCAVDGLCAKACPVAINTGAWVKKQRASQSSISERRLAAWTSEQMPVVENAMKIALKTGDFAQKIIGPQRLESSAQLMNERFGTPTWSRFLWHENSSAELQGGRFAGTEKSHSTRHAPQTLAESPSHETEVILFRSCVSRTLKCSSSESANDPLSVCAQRAGIELQDMTVEGLCCGQPWSSKGFHEASVNKLMQLIDDCYERSGAGRIPIVVDNSPCAFSILEESSFLPEPSKKKWAAMRFWDPVDLALHLADRLHLNPLSSPARFFPVCSVIKSGRLARFEALARRLCQEPIFPLQTACCGMAGDRGLWFPELTENAVERLDWSSKEAARGFCSSRTCEIALSAGRVGFESIYVALELASRPVDGE